MTPRRRSNPRTIARLHLIAFVIRHHPEGITAHELTEIVDVGCQKIGGLLAQMWRVGYWVSELDEKLYIEEKL